MDGPAAADTSFELLDRFTAAGGIATKVCSHPARPARSPGNIRAAIDDSACRLGTDEVDLYFAHRDDPETDQGEYLDAFEELIQAGQVREIGTSLCTPEQRPDVRCRPPQPGAPGGSRRRRRRAPWVQAGTIAIAWVASVRNLEQLPTLTDSFTLQRTEAELADPSRASAPYRSGVRAGLDRTD